MKRRIFEDDDLVIARNFAPASCDIQEGSTSICILDAWSDFAEEYAKGVVKDVNEYPKWLQDKNVCCECSHITEDQEQK